MRLPQQGLTLALTCTVGLVCFTSNPPELQAQPVIPGVTNTTPAKQRLSTPLEYDPPTDGRVPDDGRQDAGGRVPGCPETSKPLTALVPENYIGLTVAKHPTFWVYVPYAPEIPLSAKFVLRDEQQVKVYETPLFPIAQRPGVVRFTLPKEAPRLSINKRYNWSFSVTCNDGVDFVSVRSSVKRVKLPPSLKSRLQAATLQQRIALYAAKGLWHDALTELALLRSKNPQDTTLAADWADLLRSRYVRLDKFATEPIVQCCTPQQVQSQR